MKNWLIKLLGGYTQDEYYSLGCKIDSRIETFDEQIQHWHELLESREKEITRLTDIFLTRAGFLVPELQKGEQKEHKPISNRQSWPTVQKQLELEDARKQAERTRKYWEEKGARAVSEGAIGDASVSDSDTLAG